MNTEDQFISRVTVQCNSIKHLCVLCSVLVCSAMRLKEAWRGGNKHLLNSCNMLGTLNMALGLSEETDR